MRLRLTFREPTFYSWVTKPIASCSALPWCWKDLASLHSRHDAGSWRSSDRVKMASATHWLATHSFFGKFFAKPVIILFGYFFQVLLWRLWSFVLLWFLSEIFIKNTFGEFHPHARWGVVSPVFSVMWQGSSVIHTKMWMANPPEAPIYLWSWINLPVDFRDIFDETEGKRPANHTQVCHMTVWKAKEHKESQTLSLPRILEERRRKNSVL